MIVKNIKEKVLQCNLNIGFLFRVLLLGLVLIVNRSVSYGWQLNKKFGQHLAELHKKKMDMLIAYAY